MSISTRAQELNVSGIRKVFDLAAKLKNPVNLSIGQPDFDVPEEVKSSAINHIKNGFNKYTPSAGIDGLRNDLNSFLKQKHVTADDIIITSGVSGGIFLSLLALINPGDEVIVPDPYFVMYKELPKLLGAKVVTVDTYPDFILDPQKLKDAITPKTKLLFLNSPGNPTGRIIPKEILKEIAGVLKDTGIYVISDEIYEVFDYENLHSYFAPLYERTITLGGFSKSAAVTGWRVGYAAGQKEIIDAMIKLQQYTFVCSPSFAQYACIEALKLPTQSIKNTYRKKRDLVVEALKDKYSIVKPDGAFYIFLAHPKFNGEELVSKAIEKEVLLIPGNSFSLKNTHFRLSFANKDAELKKGVERLLDIE